MTQTGRGSLTQHNLQINFLELYRNDDRIFSEISFDLSEGQHLLISGANGTGKTSLLRVICGLTIPTGGTILWNQLATNALIPELTARENLEYTFEGNQSMNRTSSVLEAFDLNNYLDQYAEKLSNGQIRKIALSRILLSEKTLWILDEPVANLDTSGTQFLLAEMQAHLDQGGMLITTSNLNDQTLKPSSEINLDKA